MEPGESGRTQEGVVRGHHGAARSRRRPEDDGESGPAAECSATTLLVMTGAAIGGKAGVSYPRQKNLIGTFSHPAEVHIHLGALTTLPRPQLVSASGEALTNGIVEDPLPKPWSGFCVTSSIAAVLVRWGREDRCRCPRTPRGSGTGR
ncbi:hypothetical protein ACFYP6_38320 [Streptomyces goshikiensis]|uniref:hypothetical protein n=1 Tax=Streptomyces goshikiensis TaxID=1942 RepID=UPI0036C3B6B3